MQYNILRILRGAGSNGLSCGDVASRLVTPGPDTTRLLDRMVRRKWIRRDHDRQDRRVVQVRITASGLSLLASLEPKVESIQEKQFQRLAPRDLKQLIVFLEALRDRR